jgi:tryptophan-rich sensory protein
MAKSGELNMFIFLSIVAWTAFVFWQLYTATKEDIKWYLSYQPYIQGAPPSWAFGVVWSIIYALLVAVAVLTFQDDTEVALFVVFAVNIAFNKVWTQVFFRSRNMIGSLVVIVIVLLTAITVAVLLAIKEMWLPFGLYIIYPIWTIFALYLNVRMFELTKPVPIGRPIYVRRK